MDIPENVRQEVINLIPASVYHNLVCFVFYDHHPKDERNIDITICTKDGDIKEFFQRDLLSSVNLACKQKPEDIKITRNSNSELFYTVAAGEDLFIISSKDTLEIHKKITNVCKYEIVDSLCSGQGSLKVIKKDDAVPIIYNSNFECHDDEKIIIENPENETYPIITKLQQKLVEAKYTTKTNEDTLRNYLNIRHNATLLMSQNLHPNLKDSVFKDDLNKVTGGLKLNSSNPQITVCNKKLLIILDVINSYDEPLEEIHIFLNTAMNPSLVYCTKLFTKLPTSPYWEEKTSNTVKPNQETALIAVMNIDEVQYNVTSRIELAGCIYYKKATKDYLLPFDDVLVSSLKTMGDEFDVLSSSGADDRVTILSILASTQKLQLTLRHIKSQDEPEISLQELFCKHLQMDKITNNIIVYRRSPYHVLNGVMVIFEETWNDKAVTAWVYSRSPSQVLALIHCINDAVPTKIVATTSNYKITANTEELSQFSEEIPPSEAKYNFKEYAKSMLTRATKVLEYLDNSMIKMSESKNTVILSKIGSEIDLFAGGMENFKEFKSDILVETKKGIDCLFSEDKIDSGDSDVMIIE